MFLWNSFCVPLDTFPEVGLMAEKVDLFLIFWGTSILFSMVVVPVCTPTNSSKAFPVSTSLPALVLYWFIYGSSSGGYEVIPHYSFNLHVCDDYWLWASFHVSLGHLYVLFGEVSIQVLCPFFNWVVFFHVVFCKFFLNFGYEPLIRCSSEHVLPFL